MTDYSRTPRKPRQIPLKIARLLILATAVMTGGGLLGLASSAQAHHGGSHSIKVDQSGEYEALGPNWNSLMTPVTIAGGVSLLGLGSYLMACHSSRKPKA